MRIIKCYYSNNYVGCDEEQCYILGNVSDDQVDHMLYCDFDEYCENMAYVAQGYPWESFEDGGYTDEEEMLNDRDQYYEDCSWEWEEITLDELKEWCAHHYNEYEDYFADRVAAQLALEAKEERTTCHTV